MGFFLLCFLGVGDVLVRDHSTCLHDTTKLDYSRGATWWIISCCSIADFITAREGELAFIWLLARVLETEICKCRCVLELKRGV